MPHLKKIVFLSLILLVQSGAGILGAAWALDVRYTGTIQPGVTIKGIPVGGLTQAEAARKLESVLGAPLEHTLELKGAGKSYLISMPDIDGRYDCLSTAEEALDYGKKGKVVNRLISILRYRAAPVDLAVKIAFSEAKLAERIKNLQSKWEAPPKDAGIRISNGKVVTIAERTGYSLDFEKTLEQARLALARGNMHTSVNGRVLEPEITSSDLGGINTLMAEYATALDESELNRTHNVALASAAVNGSLLKPGKIFSLNQRIGPRLAETGYLKAPVFIDNRLALDIGGGICQVATTLYNAALLADLTVVERYSHPLPVSYVSPGRDATIAGDYLDLKFVNNTDTPVYISSLIESDTLTVRIFGVGKNNGNLVRITSEKSIVEPNVVIINDSTLAEGETRVINSGKIGYEARVYREVVVDGLVKSRTEISNDYYRPVDKIIYLGTKSTRLKK